MTPKLPGIEVGGFYDGPQTVSNEPGLAACRSGVSNANADAPFNSDDDSQ